MLPYRSCRFSSLFFIFFFHFTLQTGLFQSFYPLAHLFYLPFGLLFCRYFILHFSCSTLCPVFLPKHIQSTFWTLSLTLFISPAGLCFALHSLCGSLVTVSHVLASSPKKLCAVTRAQQALLSALPPYLGFMLNRQYRVVVRVSSDLSLKIGMTTF